MNPWAFEVSRKHAEYLVKTNPVPTTLDLEIVFKFMQDTSVRMRELYEIENYIPNPDPNAKLAFQAELEKTAEAVTMCFRSLGITKLTWVRESEQITSPYNDTYFYLSDGSLSWAFVTEVEPNKPLPVPLGNIRALNEIPVELIN